MFKEKRIIMAGVIIMAFIATALFLPGLIHAGNMGFNGQSPSYLTGDDADLYASVPWWFYRFAWVEKTGQTETYVPGDDGDLQRGVAWPNPRFVDNWDGTVRDQLTTTLTWMKNANCFGYTMWDEALDVCNNLADGQCGLTDGSQPGDWRLPNRNELESLLHLGYFNPALPNTEGTGQWSEGDPFTGVQSGNYWSSTTSAYYTYNAWNVNMNNGNVNNNNKDNNNYVWCVRGRA